MPKPTSAIKTSDREKPWNKKKNKGQPYNINSIPPKKSFLIICEGENTEVQYFEAFPIITAKVKVLGKKASKTALVKKAIKEAKSYKGYEIWCVFDFDIKPDNLTIKSDFNEAINLAKKNQFRVAYSNDAFELWFVLHFKDINTQFTRFEYYKILREKWNINYEKEGKDLSFCKANYKRLQELPASQELAIKRAEKLYNSLKEEKYCDQNPCTTVFELVRELNTYIE